MLSDCAGMMHTVSTDQFNASINSGNFDTASKFAMEKASYNPEEQSVDNIFCSRIRYDFKLHQQYDSSIELLDASENMMNENTEGVENDTVELGLSLQGNP